MLGFGMELVWTASGTHPLNMPTPPKGGTIEADRAEGKDLLLLGIQASRDPDAAPVSYTHLDVYKRQVCGALIMLGCESGH